MHKSKDEAFPRDRKGEIFQGDLGEDHTANPHVREDAAHDLNLDEAVDSEEADEFMRDRKAPTSGTRPAQHRK